MKPTFWLNLQTRSIHSNGRTVTLRPKVFALLQFLLGHLGKVVTTEEVRNAIWGKTRVSHGTLKNCVLELRGALGDSARTSRYIQTIPRRGYCLITPIPTAPSTTRAPGQRMSLKTKQANLINSTQLVSPYFVGYEPEQAVFDHAIKQLLAGVRQCLFVTGEVGAGKSTLLEKFLSTLRPESWMWSLKGHCVEHRGPQLAYLPVIDALDHLVRSPGRELVLELLRNAAPSWLPLLPLSTSPHPGNYYATDHLPHERLVREFASAVEALAQHRPLLLWFEDLHWADTSTLDLLNFLIHRGNPARWGLFSTFRPYDALRLGHGSYTFVQKLLLSDRAIELPMRPFTDSEVVSYLSCRFPVIAPSQIVLLASWLYQRTEGNPLFITLFVDGIVARGHLQPQNNHALSLTSLQEMTDWVPDKLQQLTQSMVQTLSSLEMQLLSAASVIDEEFSAAAVAAATGVPVDEVDAACHTLAIHQLFLVRHNARYVPERRQASRYVFRHRVQRAVIYQSTPLAQRSIWHRRIAQWMEKSFGERACQYAETLALHFERGHDVQMAFRYRVARQNGHATNSHRDRFPACTETRVPGGVPVTENES